MTLVLGLHAQDGLLLVSDSQVTIDTAGQPVKATHDKIFAPWNNVAWGASTNRGGVVQQVGDHLTATFNNKYQFAKRKRHEIRASLTKEVSNKVREILQRAIQIPGQQPILVNFIFVGYAQDGPFILEIHPDLTDTDHVSSHGYAAIGSAEIFPYYALIGLRHYNIRQRTLAEAKLIGYRIVQDAINAAAFGIGPPIQMIEIARPTAGEQVEARKLIEDDIRILDESVVAWKEAEVEVLSRQLGLPVQPVSAETAQAETVPASVQPPPEPSQ